MNLSNPEPIAKPSSTLRPSLLPTQSSTSSSSKSAGKRPIRSSPSYPSQPQPPHSHSSHSQQAQQEQSESEDENGLKKLRPEWARGLKVLEMGNDVGTGFS